MLPIFIITTILGTPPSNGDKIICNTSLESKRKINPVDLGHILLPPNFLVIPEGESAIIKLKLENTSSLQREFLLSIYLGKELHKEELISLPSGGKREISEEMVLPKGEHIIKMMVKEGKETIEEKEWKVIVEKPASYTTFGATYCDLRYDMPVLFYKDGQFERKSWDEVWRNGPYADVLVRFPNGARLAFWRGTSYIPIWAQGKSGFSYEWVEVIAPRGPEYVDCIEPLMDKECRYSRVAIIHNTPARVLIHWRYAESDFNYLIFENEWVDEYYYLYPDGIGVRTVLAWLAPKVKHEMNELITILPPAVHPNDVLPSNAVDFLDLEGNKQAITWPQPKLNWSYGKPSIIRVKLKEDFHPIMVVPAISEFTAVWDGWKDEKGNYISPCYWGNHWPVTRNLQTVAHPPIGWEEGPAHASLISMIHTPIKEEDVTPSTHKTIWSHLIGTLMATEDDSRLLLIATSWLKPGKLESRSKNIQIKGYDILQRAYVIQCLDKSESITLRLEPEDKILNPAFLFLDFDGELSSLSVDGESLTSENYRRGIEEENGRKNLILWLERLIDKPVEIVLKTR